MTHRTYEFLESAAVWAILTGAALAVVSLFIANRSRGAEPEPVRPSPQCVLVPDHPVNVNVMIRAAPPAPADSPQGFVASLNAARAQVGMPALVWDQNLANAAALNAGRHQPGTNGGGWQVWAPVRSFAQSLVMWRQSGPHHAILFGPHRYVGVSLCPSGCTANVR